MPTLTRLEKRRLSGCAFMDENLDGVLQSGETAVSGMTVELLNADGQLYTTTVTDMSGLWRFDNVPAGDWRVRRKRLKGWRWSASWVHMMWMRRARVRSFIWRA